MAIKKNNTTNNKPANVTKQNIKYYLNDPTTPTLTEVINFAPSTLFSTVG